MEGDISRRHIKMGVKNVYLVSLICPEVANKYVFQSARASVDKEGE